MELKGKRKGKVDEQEGRRGWDINTSVSGLRPDSQVSNPLLVAAGRDAASRSEGKVWNYERT